MNLNKLIADMEIHRDELAVAIKVLKKFTAPARAAASKAAVDTALKMLPEALIPKAQTQKSRVLQWMKKGEGSFPVGVIAAELEMPNNRVSTVLHSLKKNKLVKRTKTGWVVNA